VGRPSKIFKKIPELWFPVPLVMYMKTYYWLNRNRFLSHLRTSFCALAIAGASLALPSAEADPPMIPAIGTYSPCFHKISEQQVGPNRIIIYNVTAETTGTFTGSLIDGYERDVIHPDGSITFNGTATFVHQSECGTVEFTYTGTGNFNTHEESGHFVGNQGTGCLAGIYSVGTFEGVLDATRDGCDVAGDNVSYSGQVVFTP
jgi:hypothetical protein